MLSLREWGCAAGGRRGSPRVLEGRHQARSRGGASAAGSRTCALLRAFPRLPWSACVWGTVGVRSHRWQGSSGWGEQRGGGAAWGCRKACRLQWGSLASCRWDLPARPLPCSAHPFPAGPARTPGSCRGTQVYFLPLKCTSGSGVHGVCAVCRGRCRQRSARYLSSLPWGVWARCPGSRKEAEQAGPVLLLGQGRPAGRWQAPHLDRSLSQRSFLDIPGVRWWARRAQRVGAASRTRSLPFRARQGLPPQSKFIFSFLLVWHLVKHAAQAWKMGGGQGRPAPTGPH